MKTEKIMERVRSDYDYVTSLGYNCLGVFLQGSQNYLLSHAGSDIDTKAIIIPSFEDFVLNKKPVSTTLILPSNEHVDLKDIRLMHECFLKQNINFLEILFTKYKYINPEYINIYQPMFDNKERIAHYNNYAAVNCIAGMAYEKRKALCHPYPSTKEEIEQYGYSSKELHHIARCDEFLSRYIFGKPYQECLVFDNITRKRLIRLKITHEFTADEAEDIADSLINGIKDRKKFYMEDYPLTIDEGVKEIMNDVLIDVLKYNFKKDIR